LLQLSYVHDLLPPPPIPTNLKLAVLLEDPQQKIGCAENLLHLSFDVIRLRPLVLANVMTFVSDFETMQLLAKAMRINFEAHTQLSDISRALGTALATLATCIGYTRIVFSLGG
jgi:hypothetical protein